MNTDTASAEHSALSARELAAVPSRARGLLQRLVTLLGAHPVRAALLIVATLITVAGAWARVFSPADLARGRAWKTSTADPRFDLRTRVLGGQETNLLFCTREEDSPWAAVDLGTPQRVRSVTVRNRTDASMEAAAPLALEGSVDGTHWETLARRERVFHTWDAAFAATRVRFLRVRALHRTALQLERVEIHG